MDLYREYWTNESCLICQAKLVQKGRGVTCPTGHFYTRYSYPFNANKIEFFVEFLMEKYVFVFMPKDRLSIFKTSDGTEVAHLNSNQITPDIICSVEKSKEFIQNYEMLK